jgi:transposase
MVAAVPWARHGAWCTRAFEDTAAWLAVHTSRVAVAELLWVAWRTAGRIVTRVVEEASQDIDRLEGCGASASTRSPTARATAT